MDALAPVPRAAGERAGSRRGVNARGRHRARLNIRKWPVRHDRATLPPPMALFDTVEGLDAETGGYASWSMNLTDRIQE